MLQAGLEGAALGLELISLRQAIDQLELRFARLSLEFDQSECWDYEGANSAIDWIRINCKMTSNAVSDRIAVSEHEADLVESIQAMDAGEIGFAHLAVLARTANVVGDSFDEADLLGLAKESSPGKLHYNCLHYRHAINAEAYAEDQAGQAHTRTVHMSTGSDGCLFITGCSTRSEALWFAMRWNHWRDRPEPTTTACVLSVTPTPSSSWPATTRRSRCR